MPKNNRKKMTTHLTKGRSAPGARKGSETYNLLSTLNDKQILYEDPRKLSVGNGGQATETPNEAKMNELMRNIWRVSWAAGHGHAPKKEYTPGSWSDSHVWLQKGDHIIDPTPTDGAYKGLQQHYKAWEGRSRTLCFLDWKKRYEAMIRENFIKYYMEQVKENDIMEWIEIMNDAGARKQIFQACSEKFKVMFKAKPQERQCYYNIMACKDDYPGYKVMFGSMGYEVEPGTIFWEFG